MLIVSQPHKPLVLNLKQKKKERTKLFSVDQKNPGLIKNADTGFNIIEVLKFGSKEEGKKNKRKR